MEKEKILRMRKIAVQEKIDIARKEKNKKEEKEAKKEMREIKKELGENGSKIGGLVTLVIGILGIWFGITSQNSAWTTDAFGGIILIGISGIIALMGLKELFSR